MVLGVVKHYTTIFTMSGDRQDGAWWYSNKHETVNQGLLLHFKPEGVSVENGEVELRVSKAGLSVRQNCMQGGQAYTSCRIVKDGMQLEVWGLSGVCIDLGVWGINKNKEGRGRLVEMESGLVKIN